MTTTDPTLPPAPGWSRISHDVVRCHVRSEVETNSVGRQIASYLQAGDVVAISGNLGAGKTRLVKAIAQGKGVPPEEVNSPTFTLIHEYEGTLPIRHCDTYRLRRSDEFAELGLDELFAPDGIALIEWAERVIDDLPRDRLMVNITIDSPDERTIDVSSSGRKSSRIVASLCPGGH